MKFGKKQLVMAGLIVALGAAVFLNWKFSDANSLLTATTNDATAKELGKAQYANATYTTGEDLEKTKDADSEKEASNDLSTDVMTLNEVSNDEYFKTAKESRDESQQHIIDIATEILKNTESDNDARTEAVKSATQIANIIQQQTNIESLILSKGFSQCLAFIQNGECSIVVNKGVLSEALAVTIKDIVSSQAGITFDKITITEV